jgi:glycosyltransferase involved in cell wall biosynthesis
MRILHITDDYAFTGGIQSYLSHLVDLLTRKGHSAEIYSPSECRAGESSFLNRWISYKDYFAVERMIAEFEPDILHGHSISMRISPLPFRAAKKKKVPVVMTVHDFNYVCPRKWMIYRDQNPCSYGFGLRCLVSNCLSTKRGWLYLPYHDLRWLKIALHRLMLKRYVRTFICPSKVLRQWMKESLNVHNVVYIPNFVKRNFSPQENTRNDNQLLFVGRLSEEKGVACLLKAMPFVLSSCPDAFLTIVGNGPERPKLEYLSHRLKIEKNVCFAGMVNNDRVGEYYRRAAICLLPSLWMENCPVTALEAIAFGKPLVGSNIGGIPAMIQDGKTGFLFRRNDPEDLAEKIGLLIKKQELLRLFENNSLLFFQQSFAEEKHYEEIVSLYASLKEQ